MESVPFRASLTLEWVESGYKHCPMSKPTAFSSSCSSPNHCELVSKGWNQPTYLEFCHCSVATSIGFRCHCTGYCIDLGTSKRHSSSLGVMQPLIKLLKEVLSTWPSCLFMKRVTRIRLFTIADCSIIDCEHEHKWLYRI